MTVFSLSSERGGYSKYSLISKEMSQMERSTIASMQLGRHMDSDTDTVLRNGQLSSGVRLLALEECAEQLSLTDLLRVRMIGHDFVREVNKRLLKAQVLLKPKVVQASSYLQMEIRGLMESVDMPNTKELQKKGKEN